ncbi:ergothioneine biosynthesis protein EgtB [Pontibacter harenae]|uniref:ergothioneine biosynthesis protein EgtB n=1 Tax=Pontibacter harenae TaxID=2894083 RepID=UPI001E332DA3|nr:ergothioneine biosynthesis protein EgtB [Pontibacter harenae]MCC9168979.1 ergothioneine biosynthesis protein EgtB [Pontibacter harenae]
MTELGLAEAYKKVRQASIDICQPLKAEDYVIQPIVDVSPPKWHLGHSTWFFETFILKPHARHYREFHPAYNYVFNSYYETVGARVIRTDRGNLSRPTVEEVYDYRNFVDLAMADFLKDDPEPEVKELLVLGLNHEQQHQELLYTDIKYILGHNPLFPAYGINPTEKVIEKEAAGVVNIPAGIYEIGFKGDGFCFDNELGRHKVYLHEFKISKNLVSNREYLEFVEDGGYRDFRYWHAEGWDWVNSKGISAPLYWYNMNGKWMHYTLSGLQEIPPAEPVCHISYYEAAAYAAWRGMRLPTEAEWEVAADQIKWGKRWEWTNSAYLPYPGYKRAAGAVGEYNGKFMVNQMVLRGASVATPAEHSRKTYRNFFHPQHQWQFTGIRLAE